MPCLHVFIYEEALVDCRGTAIRCLEKSRTAIGWLPWVSIEGYSSGLLFDIDGYSEVILRIRIIVSFTDASRQLSDL
jgi:hypothetical protein